MKRERGDAGRAGRVRWRQLKSLIRAEPHELVELADFGGFDGGRAFLAGSVSFGLFAIGEDSGELFIVVIHDDNAKLIVFAKGPAERAPLVSGEFHCKKGIMSNHGPNEKAGSTESYGPPLPLWTRESDPSRDADREGVQERVLASGV